ncbi:MAG: peptidoglycan editing factor PgeF [Sulfurimonadaceae bacterium]
MQNLSSRLLNRFKQITHAFTTRHNGMSNRPYNSNNLAFHVGDNADDVIKNQEKLALKMGYDLSKLVHMQQIHSDKIIVVDPDIHNFENPPECDALITNQPRVPLMVMTADCTPVLLFDSVQNVIAVAHAGRAGAVKAIVPKTIEKMCNDFECKIENITVVLGPSIHGCCYEVGEKIAKEVADDGYGFAVIAKEGSYYLEVNAIIHRQLQETGVKKENIEDLDICNACENRDFFSYRADKQKTGRIAGVLMLRS